MKPSSLLSSALLCGIAASALAQEQDRRFYLGVDVGQAQLNREFSEYAGPGGEGHATAWKLRFGWRASPHWSFEAGYTDFGEHPGTATVAVAGPADQPVAVSQGNVSTTAKGFDVSAVGTWPVSDRFHLNGSAGLMRREMKATFDPVLLGAPAFRAKDGDLAIQYGIGVGFVLGEAWELGLNWMVTSNLEGDFEFPENQSDPDLLSLGVRYRL